MARRCALIAYAGQGMIAPEFTGADVDLPVIVTVLVCLSLSAATIACVGCLTHLHALRPVRRISAPSSTTLWRTSPVELEHFDSATIQVDRQGMERSGCVGLALSDEQIKLLSGAPSHSMVRVQYISRVDWARQNTGADRPPPGLYFYVTGPGLQPRTQNVVGLYRTANGDIGLYLKDIMLDERLPAGAAGRMLVRMARAGIALGVREMRLLAAGGRNWPSRCGTDRWMGYTAWPGYGFNMPLLPETKALFSQFPHHPPGLMQCHTVQDLLSKRDGDLFWRVAGDGWFMTFDLTHPNTPSVQTLLSKLQRKGA